MKTIERKKKRKKRRKKYDALLYSVLKCWSHLYITLSANNIMHRSRELMIMMIILEATVNGNV